MSTSGKSLLPLEWEALIEDFQSSRLDRWTSQYSLSTLLDLALSSLLKKDNSLSLKLILLTFLDEFSLLFFTHSQPPLDHLLDTLRLIIQSPIDNLHVTFTLKEQALVTVTSVFVAVDVLGCFGVKCVEALVELLLVVVNRPSNGFDRHVRGVACECLRELERCYEGLLSEVVGHLWGLCQNERTHACQGYLLLFSNVVCNVVRLRISGVSVLSCSLPLTPFNVPKVVVDNSTASVGSGLNYKELRRAMAFLLECTQLFTPCGMIEFVGILIPLALALELQASMLKVQFFSLIYTYDPMLCHVVLMLLFRFRDAFDGQDGEIARRLVLTAKETHHHLVFRLLALHWLWGLLSSLEVSKRKAVFDIGLDFFPSVFDPLALKALKLDLLAFCTISLGAKKSDSNFGYVDEEIPVKLFKDGLVSVSAFKWLPPWSSETSVAFHTLHKFLIGASSYHDTSNHSTQDLTESAIFHFVKETLVTMTLEFYTLVPVVVAFVDQLLGCEKHNWLGECMLQTFDKNLVTKVTIDHKLVSYFAIFDRIAGNETITPRRLLELLTKFMVYLVEKHGPDTGLKSWSQSSKILGICRTMLMHHRSSRLFLPLSRLLAFTSLYFPDLEVRDNARIYLRMLVCMPGKKLRGLINRGPDSGSFFSVQSPQSSVILKKPRNLSSYIHLERVVPLLVKQSWSLASSTFGVGNNNLVYLEGIKDYEPQPDDRDIGDGTDVQNFPRTERTDQPPELLRVMDSKVSEILGILRRHFSCIPDYRHMPGTKVNILCNLWFESEPFTRMLENKSPSGNLDNDDSVPAIYATVLKFSSSASYGRIPSNHIPFLLGDPQKFHSPAHKVSLDIVPVDNGSGKEDFKATVTIELEPREPTPGLVDVFIETNADNGKIIHGSLQGIPVGIEDMFLKTVIPPDIPDDVIPSYQLDLFNALWEACGTPCSIGRETFPLKGGKGAAAVNGTQSVKLLEVPSSSVIQATERYLAPFVVSVMGELLVDIVRGGRVIEDVIWKYTTMDACTDVAYSVSDLNTGPLRLKYIDDEDDRESHAGIGKRNMGCILILIFLPPRFHLLFQMEVADISTLVRIRTDHWPCLAYIDDYMEALFST